MEERSILKGNCEYCGPSQAGPEPLPSPRKVTGEGSLLVERPVSATAKAILPATDIAGPPSVQQMPAGELQKNQEILTLLGSGIPYVAVFDMGGNEMKFIPGNGVRGVIIAGLLHYAMKQC